MEFKKNQEIILTIDDLGNNGEGIGHVDGYALFVKDALPGETIRAKVMKCKKNYGFAKLLEILPGEARDVGRVKPACPVARQCGGCRRRCGTVWRGSAGSAGSCQGRRGKRENGSEKRRERQRTGGIG